MGLDSFWRDENNESGNINGEFRICGGMLSDHGNSSFRGKVYEQLIISVTGVSLYQELIPAETVKQMAESLENKKWDSLFGFTHDIDEQEYNDLVKMFVEHAKENHHLVGWW